MDQRWERVTDGNGAARAREVATELGMHELALLALSHRKQERAVQRGRNW